MLQSELHAVYRHCEICIREDPELIAYALSRGFNPETMFPDTMPNWSMHPVNKIVHFENRKKSLFFDIRGRLVLTKNTDGEPTQNIFCTIQISVNGETYIMKGSNIVLNAGRNGEVISKYDLASYGMYSQLRK